MKEQLMKAMMNRGGKGNQPQVKQNIEPPKQNVEPPKQNIQPPKPTIQPAKPNIQTQVKPPSVVPVPNLKVPVPTVGGGGGKIPPAPLIPKAPPIPTVNKVNPPKPVTTIQPQKQGKKLNLQEELALKKGGLKKVEVKEYVSPALKKDNEGGSTSSSSSGGGGMKEQLMKAMMNIGGKGNQPKKMQELPKKNIPTTNTIENKPTIKPPEKTTNTTNPPGKLQNKFPIPEQKVEVKKPQTKPETNISTSFQQKKPDISKGGGFQAMRNFLANRMAPSSSKQSSETKEPSKPIVEVASSSTTGKMDINALISGMSKKMEGNSSSKNTTTEKIETPKVIGGSGPGIPPPPIKITNGIKAPINPPSISALKVPSVKAPIPQKVPNPPSTIPQVKAPSVPVPNITVPVPTVGGGGKVPIPPPIPKAPPIPQAPNVNVSKQVPQKTVPAKKQLSMAEEMAKLKLKKVETQEKFGLKAQKENSSKSGSNSNTSSSGGNNFFAQLSAVKLKKVGK